MKKLTLFSLAITFMILLSACIKDDFINDQTDPILRITSLVESIEVNTAFQFEALFLNNIGQEELVSPIWTSSSPDVISITNNGLATAQELGEATIYVQYENAGILLTDSIVVNVGETTVVTVQSSMGTIQTTSSYVLTGDFVYESTMNGVRLSIEDNYQASTALPGLYIYLSNNKNSIADAFEIGAVTVFSGAHEYNIDNVGFTDYQFVVYFCKPFNVKVGDGTL